MPWTILLLKLVENVPTARANIFLNRFYGQSGCNIVGISIEKTFNKLHF